MKRIKSAALTLTGAILISLIPVLAASAANPKFNGVAEPGGDPTITPTASYAPNDNQYGKLGSNYSPGYALVNVSTGSSYGGSNWPALQSLPTLINYGFASGDQISLNFELPADILTGTGTVANPNLTFVVQDNAGDYWYSGIHQSGTVTYQASGHNGYNGFQFVAPYSSFVRSGGSSNLTKVRKLAVVWIGYVDSSVTMWMTNPVVTSSGTAHQPSNGDYVVTGADTTFNFQ